MNDGVPSNMKSSWISNGATPEGEGDWIELEEAHGIPGDVLSARSLAGDHLQGWYGDREARLAPILLPLGRRAKSPSKTRVEDAELEVEVGLAVLVRSNDR